ncbi:cyclic AMP-dependent transcription factor ATF-6 alpha [Pelobates cultripes]|uniref:Cyclic AMP-dependent transcription factor ATF-6 alpha n=1 Tax=Pelobates cultripes TaxID=61616 RepID=A0AAD1TKN0_PELCU|nr:cyclic AMP-dependent transcription factor ATF-6 alpha [Pelobates cultripes]
MLLKPLAPTAGHPPVKPRKLAPVVPKPVIQPKPVLIPSAAATPTPATVSSKTIIFQPLSTILPKQQPFIALQAAPPSGQQVLLSSVMRIPSSGVITSQPVITIGASQLSAPSINLLSPASPENSQVSPVKTLFQSSAQESSGGTDINIIRRQQRMIKNRESAFQSRRKKKEYMQSLELRLRSALLENERLKNENGSLQKLLEEVVSENQKLKVSAPKRRAVCLMMVAVFLILNFNSLSFLGTNSGPYEVEISPIRHNRHLLELSDGDGKMESRTIPSESKSPKHYISDEKALMVVKKESLVYIPPPPPCHPHVNQTETLRLNQELRGWVHRHEVERTKSRRMTNSQRAQVVQNGEDKSTSSQLVTMQYTDSSLKNSVSELQIYYSSPRSYQDFLEAIRRRGDTFYVVSFRRDHLLLPATNRNKTTRPKMSIILPSTNVNGKSAPEFLLFHVYYHISRSSKPF